MAQYVSDSQMSESELYKNTYKIILSRISQTKHYWETNISKLKDNMEKNQLHLTNALGSLQNAQKALLKTQTLHEEEIKARAKPDRIVTTYSEEGERIYSTWLDYKTLLENEPKKLIPIHKNIERIKRQLDENDRIRRRIAEHVKDDKKQIIEFGKLAEKRAQIEQELALVKDEEQQIKDKIINIREQEVALRSELEKHTINTPIYTTKYTSVFIGLEQEIANYSARISDLTKRIAYDEEQLRKQTDTSNLEEIGQLFNTRYVYRAHLDQCLLTSKDPLEIQTLEKAILEADQAFADHMKMLSRKNKELVQSFEQITRIGLDKKHTSLLTCVEDKYDMEYKKMYEFISEKRRRRSDIITRIERLKSDVITGPILCRPQQRQEAAVLATRTTNLELERLHTDLQLLEHILPKLASLESLMFLKQRTRYEKLDYVDRTLMKTDELDYTEIDRLTSIINDADKAYDDFMASDSNLPYILASILSTDTTASYKKYLKYKYKYFKLINKSY